MPAALVFPVLVAAAAEPATQPISVQTVIIILLGIGLLLAAKSIVGLQRRVDTLTAAAQPKSPKANTATNGPPPPEILVVITAAVFETLGSDHRIVAISALNQNHSWSQEGRRQIFGSRKVR